MVQEDREAVRGTDASLRASSGSDRIIGAAGGDAAKTIRPSWSRLPSR
jgi:hypothetical protein